MGIFKFTSYKKFLLKVIRDHSGVYGYKTRLARAARCRNSYFSQVLNADFELTPEHALGLAGFWGLTNAETDYLVGLVHLARAGTPELRRYHEAQCRKIAAEQERSQLRGAAREVAPDAMAEFYSSWHYTAIHDLTTFPGGQTAESAARRLELPRDVAEDALATLAAMGLVERRDSRWHAKVTELIVPEGTAQAAQHIGHWTRRAAQDALRKKRAPLESFHKCWVFGISPADYRRLRELLIDQLRKSQEIIPGSERTELACLNLNLFGV